MIAPSAPLDERTIFRSPARQESAIPVAMGPMVFVSHAYTHIHTSAPTHQHAHMCTCICPYVHPCHPVPTPATCLHAVTPTPTPAPIPCPYLHPPGHVRTESFTTSGLINDVSSKSLAEDMSTAQPAWDTTCSARLYTPPEWIIETRVGASEGAAPHHRHAMLCYAML